MSSQVDARSQSAGKRARTDGGRREDDWVCPSCNNVNFAFRTTCNMRNCNQSRPAERAKPMQTPPHYSVAGGYMGPGTPPSMYLTGGAPPYGSPIFNGPAMHRYGIPQFPGGSAYPYGYGGRMPMGSPYGPMHMAGPPPYAGGSMMGAGGMYGMPMDRYGLVMPAGPGAMGTRAGSYSDEGCQKKPAGAGRENDWECPNCHNINFAFRTVCNMRKCNTPRPENQGSKPDGSRGLKPKMPEGSWKCEQCNNINYPFRTKCNRPHCGADKPSQTNNANDSGADQDNQVSCMAATALSSSEAATKGKKARRRRGRRSSAMTMAMPKNLGWVGARRREWGRWAAELRVPRKRERLWIGTFATPKEAAHAYDAAIFCFYGEHIPKIRKLNFPTAPRPDISEHVRVRLTMANIRAIAEKYAHALTNYIPPPPPPVVPEAAPQVVVVVPPPVDASIGSAPTANYGNVNEAGVDILTVADCLLSFNPDDFDEIMHFANTA